MIVVDDLSTGIRDNLKPFEDRLTFIQGDIRDAGMLERYCTGVDYVFHHAALAAVPVSVEKPVLSAEINDIGTLNVFSAAARAKVKRVVYASSSAVYGNQETLPHSETMPPRPGSPYAAHKLLGEHYAAMFGDLYGLGVVSLRYFNVYGPRQNPSSPYSGVISIFMDRYLKGQTPTVFGDGGQSRDFVFVKDVVQANFLAAETGDADGRFVNIGTGRAVTVNRMLELLSEITDTSVTAAYAAPRAGDIYESRADVSLAGDLLGFTAQTEFSQGLGETWDWFRQSG